MASMSGGLSNNDMTRNSQSAAHLHGRNSHEHYIAHGTPTQFRGTELTILETALVYGFRHLADDDTRMKMLGILEQATASLVTRTRNTPGR